MAESCRFALIGAICSGPI